MKVSPPDDYMANVKECAAARLRPIYVWMDDDGPKSTVHRVMVPSGHPFWYVKPSGVVMPISSGF